MMKFSLMNFLKVILIAAVGVSLGACSPVKVTPDTLYVLDLIPSACPHYKPKKATLLVMPPDTVAVYSTSQMAYSLKPYHVAYYGKTRWAATPSQMLLPLVVKAIDDTNYYHAVVPSPFIGNYDYVLNTQIIELIHDYGICPPKARLIVRAQLISSGGNVIRSTEFIESSTIRRVDPYSAVFASNRATASFLEKLTNFATRKSRKHLIKH